MSKAKPASDILAAVKAGQVHFGENYVREFAGKADDLAGEPVKWHFIGPVQSNKAADLIGRTYLIHTVDRLSLAQKIETTAATKNVFRDCLVQVKLAGEDSRSGYAVGDLFGLLRA